MSSSRLVRVVVLVLACLALEARAALPTPEGLEPDVRFWESIFSTYTPDQCVFHDKENLEVVYVVKKIPGATRAAQARNIRRYMLALRGSLEHLADGGAPRNLLERRIVAVTPAETRGPETYRAAMDNLRCQRGVDLAPSFTRSVRHLGMIKRVLVKSGLPSDLAYLPHLESGFHMSARSHAGARGLWQLMPATARLEGLKVQRRVDQRTDPYKSTLAAAAIFKDLYAMAGSWPLAVTAYNYGANGTERAIRAWGKDYMRVRENHRTRVFGFAARNYYPSFLAVRNVAARALGEKIETDADSGAVAERESEDDVDRL
jgi:membrane-bound lytic murein transglycosylase D